MQKREKAKQELWCEALRNGHTMRYRALGASMSPFIKGGSILTVKPGENISIGDVILYRSGGGLTAHRVIGKRKSEGKSFFITKGDNLEYKDPLVDHLELLGRVVKVESGQKEIELDSFLRRLSNYIIAVTSPLLLPRVLYFLRRIRASVLSHGEGLYGR